MFGYKKSSIFFFKQNDNPTREDRLFNIKLLCIPTCTNTSCGQKFINYLGPVNINSLPIDLKNLFSM